MATYLPAYQSSVYANVNGNNFPASYANDGNRHTEMSEMSCSHSNMDINPWWAVDLGLPLTITGVLFTNRNQAGEYSSLSSAKAINVGSQCIISAYPMG